MDLQRLNVKFFVERAEGVRLIDFIPIFNSWIQASDGDYYDLADYSHVHAGPGVLLIAHEANISMDETDNRLGLLYSRKQPLEGSNGAKLSQIIRVALEYCRRVESEPTLRGRLKFRGSEALILINDRLLAPNTVETFRVVKPDLEELGRTMYGGADFVLEHDTADPRKRFSVRMKTPVPFDVMALLKNLNEQSLYAAGRAIT